MKIVSKLFGLGMVLSIAGCSWIPFTGGAPSATNPAAQACVQAALSEGADWAAERQATPGENGQYTIELGVSDENGSRNLTCDWDPNTGAQLRKGRTSPPKG